MTLAAVEVVSAGERVVLDEGGRAVGREGMELDGTDVG